MIIVSDRYRTQTKNLDDCIDKLYASIVDAVSEDLPGKTSAETRLRVKEL